MPKIHRYPFWISCVLISLATAGFLVILFLALGSPPSYHPELHQQFVQIEPMGLAENGAEIIYQKTLPENRWGQPVCTVTAKRTPYSVYLDGALLHEYTPGAFDHGGMVHWISLPETELAGRVLTVSTPSEGLTILAGNYSDLILHYRNTNVATLIFSGLFLVLGILIGLFSLGARAAIGAKRLRTLRYLSMLVIHVSLWTSMDSAVLQMVNLSGAIMYVLAMYAFSIGILLLVASLLAVSIGYVYQEMVKSSQMRYYQKMANTDLMTQLDSRTAFEDRVRQSPILEGPCACVVVDINNLKQANDTMGHSAGDELICTAAECILSVFDSLGCCYRMGGDEFSVLLQNITEPQVNKALAELELCISRKNLTRSFPLSLAVGHTIGQDASIDQMFHAADANMYQNKSQMKCHAAER